MSNSTKRGNKSTQRMSARGSSTPGSTSELDAWTSLVTHALNNEQWQEAENALKRAAELSPDNAIVLQLQGQLHINRGEDQLAITALEHSLAKDPAQASTHFLLSFVFKRLARNSDALTHIDEALQRKPEHPEYLFHKSSILQELHRKPEAIALLETLLVIEPNTSRYWNNAGILYNSLGNTARAIECFEKAMQLSPDNLYAFSNYLTSLHYDPYQSRESIAKVCHEWERRHAPTAVTRPETEKSASRPLKIGMISDGFRIHPVGQMIIAALERLPAHAYTFYAYSSNGKVDRITQRFQKIAHYSVTAHLYDDELAQKIRDDQIDILIDMAGYNSGSRMQVMAMQPAPLLVKWVGGLINTTGLDCIDYLISDNIESPSEDDPFYTEKLIRMPGDYICYEMPQYTPEVTSLPALGNGFITLACFNNPMKVNAVIIEQWADIMNSLENSRLFLKGGEYSSEELCEKIAVQFKAHGIDRSRLIFEGFSPHNLLLECYNRVDIALDPYPYSGGLTTCEAFIMGVPVVTMPGPTFAGRHSATHLVNAGMPELVTHSWDEYRARVIELASDLNSLATIRSHLRTVLLQSPVCDADTFAHHLHDTFRAIWQRHTENKTPAALSFNAQGQILFEGDTAPVVLQHPQAPDNDNTFRWEFEGKVIAIDHGAQLINVPVIKQMLDLGTLELVVFDPASNHTKHGLRTHAGLHYYPNIALGNGAQTTLYACQSAQRTGTLKPTPCEHLSAKTQQELQLLAEVPIGTAALDTINELPGLDWLVLDDLNDSLAVLEHGTASLSQTLLIHAKVAFQPTHARQPTFTEIAHWASRHGFRFYCFADQEKHTPIPQTFVGANRYADELTGATALFIPDHERMQSLNDNQRIKLAFLADGVYGLKGLSYEILGHNSAPLAEHYINYTTDALKRDLQPSVSSPRTPATSGSASVAAKPASSGDKRSAPTAAPETPTSNTAFDWQLPSQLSVVDIGANPIDGTPPYRGLLDTGYVSLVGFEPQVEALKKLQQKKGPHETYLPYAVGDGERKTLYLCHAEGMTSTLEPNFELLNRFQGYPIWAKVEKELPIDTHRLDDLDEVPPVDWLKIDIQGGELNVFQNAEEKLKNCLVIQTEVNFVQLYKNQPLFAEIDQWMREHGFMLHTLLEQRKRLFAPMVINNQIHQGINQLTTADAVYVRSFDQLQLMSDEAVTKLACIMHEAYGSYDYSLVLCNLLSQRSSSSGQALSKRYMEKLKGIKINNDDAVKPAQSAANLLLEHPNSYLKQIGWLDSAKSRESVTANGVMPWVTYPFVHFLTARIKPNHKVFEYGSGNSTLWLSAKAGSVVSVEHDESWYRKMKPKLPANVEYIYHSLVYGGDYGREVLKPQYGGQFDIAFVDGRDRVNCLKNACACLNEGGVIILDNADRDYYGEGSDFLLDQGFKRIDFIGMGPINVEAWSTAVFYRPGNCLNL